MESCRTNGLAHIKRNDAFFMAVSKMLVTLARIQENTTSSNQETTGHSQLQEYGLIVPSDGADQLKMLVQKDGPGKKGASAMTLRTLDGQLYFFDNGNMAQNGAFKYFHVAPNNMSVALQIGLGQGPSLVPPFEIETVLREQHKKSTPTSQVSILIGVKSGLTLALEYDDSAHPPYAKLITITDENLQMILEMEGRSKSEKSVQPIITRRTLAEEETDGNNVALYFITSQFYYYIHVDSDVNPPGLKLERIAKDDQFDPHKDFVRHLQFMYKVLFCECPNCSKSSRDHTDGSTEPCLKSKNEVEPSPSDSLIQVDASPENKDLSRSESEGYGKPSSLSLYAQDARQNSVEKDSVSKKQMIASTPPEKEIEESDASKDVDSTA